MSAPGSCDLGTRYHCARFPDHNPGPVAQARGVEIRPDLAGASSDNGVDRKSVSLGERTCIARFRRTGKAGQGSHRRSQKREYREGRERFDHLGLLTVACGRSRCFSGSLDNRLDDVMFRRTQIIFSTAVSKRRAEIRALAAPDAKGQQLTSEGERPPTEATLLGDNVLDLTPKLDPENRSNAIPPLYGEQANNGAGQNVFGKVRHCLSRFELHFLEGVNLDASVIG